MAYVMTFDSLYYANQLKSVGVPEKQAEMQAILEKKQIDSINGFINDSIATKQDIKELDLKIKEIDLKITEVKAEIAQMGYKITIRLGGMIVVAVTILGFLIQL